eukprot:s6960_g1.t1
MEKSLSAMASKAPVTVRTQIFPRGLCSRMDCPALGCK